MFEQFYQDTGTYISCIDVTPLEDLCGNYKGTSVEIKGNLWRQST